MSHPDTLQRAALVLAILAMAAPQTTQAQLRTLARSSAGQPLTQNDPVTFSSDQVEYDRDDALVIAKGHVEAWQNGHILRGDRITFDRNTGVAAAVGDVVLLEPDGQVLFADYAETSRDMNQAVLKDMRALLAQNGRLAANGARRTEGQINELTRVVYSTCDLCIEDPTRAPLWQLRAASAVQDLEHKRIEYRDVSLEMYGIPVAYAPYFWHPDPSVPRQSGFLIPYAGVSSNLGGFYGQPYYWAIDPQSDATITPLMTTHQGPNLDIEYRRRFNSGYMMFNVSGGYVDHSLQGTLVSRGQFSLDDTWRWGYEINRATSADYVRIFHTGTGFAGDPNVLPSQIYAEGFGEGAYSRLDSKFYQGLTQTIRNSQLPLLFPRYQYSYFGTPDRLGGRLSVDTVAFNVLRSDGTNTRRASLTLNWDRPFTGAYGDLWTIKLHGDAAAYDASRFFEQPNFGPRDVVNTARALPQAAMDARWPFVRESGAWGSQVLEPMAEVIIAPQAGDSQLRRYPNEDSLDFEFSDANLFGFNRFPGVDRLEGGTRANLAMHGAWYLGGTTFDGLIGQSYRTTKESVFPALSGLRDQISDVVARTTFTPADWLDLTYRTRLDRKSLAVRMMDATVSAGAPLLRLNAGYLYSVYDPTAFYETAQPPPTTSSYYTPRNEVTVGASSTRGRYTFRGFARRNVNTNTMVALGADAIYEDECFITNLKFYRRYTSLNGDHGATTVLLLFTFKTLGQFGYRAL